MQATEKGRTVRDTTTSTLDPERLFDLLADPIERQGWDLCPSYIQQEPVAAAPGAALEGRASRFAAPRVGSASLPRPLSRLPTGLAATRQARKRHSSVRIPTR